MKNVFKNTIGLGLLTLTIGTCHAINVYNYKDGQTSIKSMSTSQVESIWSAAQPACIKDGAKLLGVNKAFKDNKLGYRDCSSSDNAKKKQELLGYKVTVIKLTELPKDIALQVLGRK